MIAVIVVIALAGLLASAFEAHSLRRALRKSDTLLAMTTHSLESATLKLHTVAIYAMSLQNTDESHAIGGDLLKIVGLVNALSDAHNGQDLAG